MTYKSPHGAISPYTREYYFISFQIDHPRILQGWRFKLVVKDTCEQTKTYEISNLDVYIISVINFLLLYDNIKAKLALEQ